MTDVFIYDHVRTPRGRGKKDGSLHEVPSVRLAAKVLEAVRDRNGLDTRKVDDIIMGCVDPVMDAGAVIPKAAAFEAGYSTTAPGMQISRFCASGLDAVNLAAAKIAQGADGREDFLRNKLVTGRFFMERLMPETALRRARIEAGAETTMALAADAF